jgi:hypothetical protein
MGARATISPIWNKGVPFSEWEWHAEIIIGNHLYEDSDEHGNFTISMDGIEAFRTADDAFQWVYRWLSSRGYYTDDIEMMVKPTVGKEFHRGRKNISEIKHLKRIND